MRCRNCGVELVGSPAICPACGEDLRATKFCTRCGKKVERDTTICPNCGKHTEPYFAGAAQAAQYVEEAAQQPPFYAGSAEENRRRDERLREECFRDSSGREANAPESRYYDDGGRRQAGPQVTNIYANNINMNMGAYPGGYGEPKNKWTAFLLCLIFGVFGAHKFYEGKIGMGILYLFTVGLFGIGWLIDLIVLLGKPTYYYVRK